MFEFLRKRKPLFGSREQLWIIATVVLVLIFLGFLIYELQPKGKGGAHGEEQNLFTLPITIIYNTSDPNQKSRIEPFINSVVDPQKGLKSTTLKENWLDSSSTEGQGYIKESETKYLPIAFFDKTIEEHVQFSAISKYLQKKGEHYYFHLYPLEHLKIPATTGGQVRGGPLDKAKVVIQEYGSFTCHYCKQMEEVLTKVLKQYGSKVALVYKHYDRGGLDNMIAQASECANDQSRFWQMHDLLFRDQENLVKAIASPTTPTSQQTPPVTAEAAVRTYLEKQARTLGLNLKNFQACLDTKKYEKVVTDSTLEATDYGIGGTPAFFINQKFVDGGGYTYEQFKAFIDEQLSNS